MTAGCVMMKGTGRPQAPSRFPVRRLLLLAVVALLAGCAGEVAPDQAAVVDGHAISLADVRGGLGYQRALAEQQLQQGGLTERPDEATLSRVTLDTLIQARILQDGAQNEGIAPPAGAVQEQLDQIRAQTEAQGQSLEDALEQAGLTEAALREQIEVSVLAQAVAEELVPERSDAELRQDLTDRRDELLQVEARHVLTDDQATAERARAELEAGGDWNAVAKRYSTDQGSKDSGGKLGAVQRGATVPEFEDEVFRLAGEAPCAAARGACTSAVSEPVQTQFGWHVIQVTSVRLPTLEELRAAEAQAQQQQRQQAVADWYAELAASADVEVNPRFGSWDASAGSVQERETAPQPPAADKLLPQPGEDPAQQQQP